MMKIILFSICLFFICVSSIFAEQTALTIVSLEDSPLSFSVENKETDGLSVELVKEIQKRLNKSQKITILPWARGYKMATTMKNVMLFGTVRTEEREKLFKWVGPIVVTKLIFYAKKGSEIKINTIDDAKEVTRIATTKDFFSEQILEKAGFKNLERSTKPEDGLKKLCRGRVDLWPALNVTVPPLLKKIDASPDDVEAVFTIKVMYDYLAFSLETPDKIVNDWNKALNKIKSDGTFIDIYKKWISSNENIDDVMELIKNR